MLLILTLIFLIDPTSSFAATINYTKWDCFNSSNYPSQSPFESNLKLLLSNLVSQISVAQNGFITHKQGSSFDNDEYQAYGLALCHGDIRTGDCRRCVQTASEVVTSCPRAAKAVLWKDDCMLRYSDQPFFSLLQEQPHILLYDIDNVTDNVDDWTKLLHVTLNKVTSKAASNESSNKFGTKKAWFSPMNKYMYTLAQCTPDLTEEICTKCFREARSCFLVSRRGGVVLTPSCTIRYEIFRFYGLHSLRQSSLIHDSLAPPPATASPGKKKRSIKNLILLIIGPLAVIGMLIFLGSCLFKLIARSDDFRTLVVHFRNPVEDTITNVGSAKTTTAHKYPCFEADTVLEDLTAESLMFKLEILEAATNNFSDENKLGQGGFGIVYQGTLPNGQPVAVKRLSRISCQGAEEFKNEVLVIAKLQHRNLVRLLGFCLAGEEKLLVYEFVPNKSLNYFLFDKQNKGKLNWQMRYDIIKGIARGLVYLHEDSQPRIIHRDLKPGNILLDGNMNPKISDFGSARIFKIEQSEDATSRVVGTYGYMAPEYAMHGLFSTNSDVYSFGILVLEIISGKTISWNFRLSHEEDLLTHAWICLTEEKPLKYIDPTYTDSCSNTEVMKCIHLGLLCAQDSINERPTMSAVVQMLNSDSTTLMTPQCPRSFYGASTDSSTVSSRLSRYYGTTSSTNVSLPLSQSPEKIKETHATQLDSVTLVMEDA